MDKYEVTQSCHSLVRRDVLHDKDGLRGKTKHCTVVILLMGRRPNFT